MTYPPKMGPVAMGVLAGLVAWSAGGAQLAVVGVVRDSAGAPITSAEVTIMGRKTLSDSLGRFYVTHAAANVIEVSVRRLGYESATFSLSAADAAGKAIDVVLRRLATALAAIEVEEMSPRAKSMLKGFDGRRERGVGVFVTRAQIEERHSRYLVDVLRQQRGIAVSNIRGGGRTLRFTAHQSKNCQPLIWLDGQAAPGLDIDAIAATDVEGVELYQSIANTPSEFYSPTVQVSCGTIVIWTRRQGIEPRP